MHLKHLQYFCCLAKNEHYAQTAYELGIAQSTLSRVISQLEDELGTYLFEKTGRNIKLTKYGQIFYEHAQKSIYELNLGERKINELINPTSGIIDLGFIYTLGSEFLPSLIKDFTSIEKNKNFSFHFYQGNTPGIVENLKKNKYDLAFCSYFKDEPDIDFTLILEQELVLIVSTNHPLANYNSVTLAEAAKYPFIFVLDKTGFISNLFHEAGLDPNVICHVQEDHSIAGLVSINYGIAIIPRNEVFNYYNIKMIPIVNPTYKRPVYMATIRNRYLAPAPRAFRDFVLKKSIQNFNK